MELFFLVVVEEMIEQEEHLDEFHGGNPGKIALTNQEEGEEADSWLEATLWRTLAQVEALYKEEEPWRKGWSWNLSSVVAWRKKSCEKMKMEEVEEHLHLHEEILMCSCQVEMCNLKEETPVPVAEETHDNCCCCCILPCYWPHCVSAVHNQPHFEDD